MIARCRRSREAIPPPSRRPKPTKTKRVKDAKKLGEPAPRAMPAGRPPRKRRKRMSYSRQRDNGETREPDTTRDEESKIPQGERRPQNNPDSPEITQVSATRTGCRKRSTSDQQGHRHNALVGPNGGQEAKNYAVICTQSYECINGNI